MNIKEWKKKSKDPQYTHFDRRISIENCWDEVSNPDRVKKHGFYPFIHYTSKMRKVKAKDKERQIYYAAHKDGWIYRYYAFLLNECYNERAQQDDIDSVAVAYRTNHQGRNNIDFARDAFDFILKCSSCYVMIGDFTNFFDNLYHPYLKERLCDLLSVEQLPEDYYAVYKNVTRFSYIEFDELLKFHNLSKRKADMCVFNKLDRALTPAQLRSFKAKIKRNPNLESQKGVPQGSPISAVLANIYMLKADKEISKYVKQLNGFYMRYSDDFIIVIPETSLHDFRKHYEMIIEIVGAAGGIELKPEKTKAFSCMGTHIQSCIHEMFPEQCEGKNVIEFLGFALVDGTVRLRDKTISRYYNKVYRKACTIYKNKGFTPKGKRISEKEIYRLYSYKGSVYYRKVIGEDVSDDMRERNFLDYLHTAHIKLKGYKFIDTITPRHMRKIRTMISRGRKQN